jgi:hypothetical protein
MHQFNGTSPPENFRQIFIIAVSCVEDFRKVKQVIMQKYCAVFHLALKPGLGGKYQYFVGAFCLHIQGLCPEGGCSVFLLNVGIYLQVPVTLQGRRFTPKSSTPQVT